MKKKVEHILNEKDKIHNSEGKVSPFVYLKI